MTNADNFCSFHADYILIFEEILETVAFYDIVIELFESWCKLFDSIVPNGSRFKHIQSLL